MDQRKYLGLILTICYPCFALANPWIGEKGSTKITFDFEKHFTHPLHKTSIQDYRKIEQKIILLYERISYINSRIADAKRKKEIQENINRLESFRSNRITEIKQYISDLKHLQSYLYYNHKSYFAGTEIEYSWRDNLSFGFKGNFSQLKFSNDVRYGLFAKYNLYKRKGRIFTLKQYFEFGGESDFLETAILFGKSKQMQYKKKMQIVREIFNYSSLGFSKNIKSRFFPSKRLGYRLENTTGARLKNDFLLIYQRINYIDPNMNNLYANILKTQYKIAKEYRQGAAKITFSLGYFTDYSIVIKSPLSSGYNFGIWVEM